MRHKATVGVVVLCCFLLVMPLLARGQTLHEYSTAIDKGQEPAAPEEQPKEEEEAQDIVEEKAAELAREAERKARDFAAYANAQLAKLARFPILRWCVLVVMASVGVLSLLLGWGLFESLMVPFASTLGLVTGGWLGFSAIDVLKPDAAGGLRWGALGAGALMGLALYLFSARKAKPVAAFLTILSPFLILSAFIFPYNTALGIILLCVGLLAAAGAMVRMQATTIITTSVLGACALMGAYGLLSHLLRTRMAFLHKSFTFLVNDPIVLLIVLVVLTFVGAHYQRASALPED